MQIFSSMPLRASVLALILGVCLFLNGCSGGLSNTSYGHTPAPGLGGRKIGLLLPNHGPHAQSAKTIRDGFLAAYYTNLQAHPQDQALKFYDTSNLEAAYRQAIEENVSLIVGPLTKQEVENLIKLKLDIPVLALNTIPSSHPPAQLYQFGLIPENEVAAIVEHAQQQGHRRALILTPKSEWGHRMAEAFERAWQYVGGTPVETVMFSPEDPLPDTIQDALQVQNKSRRYDIDVILLAASPAAARQIKPLLDYYSGENMLPVYATASVFEGNPNIRETDLEGIHICDMPWVLGFYPSILEARETAAQLWPVSFKHSPRYFAFGMDAFLIASQLLNTQTLPSSGIQGMTGELKLDRRRHIQRHLICAKFKSGILVPD